MINAVQRDGAYKLAVVFHRQTLKVLQKYHIIASLSDFLKVIAVSRGNTCDHSGFVLLLPMLQTHIYPLTVFITLSVT